MTIDLKAEPLPLEVDADDVVHVGGTRVTLDSVIGAFKDGAAAEEIVSRFPTLELPDVYSVIGYYLRRPEDVESYLRQRQGQADQTREENEARFDPVGLRDRLMAWRHCYTPPKS